MKIVLPPIIVGQAPSRTSDPGRPLSGRCGAFVAELLSLEEFELRRRFYLINLQETWPGKAGKGDAFPRLSPERIESIKKLLAGRKVLILGKTAAKALGVKKEFFRIFYCSFDPTKRAERSRVMIIPHPSGINRFWNDPEAFFLARRKLRNFFK